MTLRDFRIREDLTQEELAEQIGVTQQSISRIENGRMRMSPEFAEKLKTKFQLPIDVVWEMMKAQPQPKPRRRRRGPYIVASSKG